MQEQATRRLLLQASSLSLLLLFVPFATIAISTGNAFATTASTGVVVPLYTYPGSTWNTMVQTKTANPSVPMVAIINPSNGPGGSQDANYVSGIQKLQAAGITVLGYTHTSWAARDTGSLKTEMSEYKSW